MRIFRYRTGFWTTLASFVLFPILLAAGQTPPWKGKITREGDVVVVHNPKDPIHREPVLSLSPDWTLNGPDADGPYVFSAPRDLAVDADGSLFILDIREQVVRKFDSSGRFVAAIGKKGQGPGEFMGAFSIGFHPKAKFLSVTQVGGRLSQFAPDGRFLKTAILAKRASRALTDSTGRIYAWADSTDSSEGLFLLSPDGARMLAEITHRETTRRVEPFDPRGWWTVDDADFLFYGFGEHYEILVFNPQGALVRRVLREFDPLPVSKSVIDEFKGRKVPPGLSLPETKRSRLPAYRSFFVDDQGRLFVQTWERTADGKNDLFDIFDEAGRFFGRTALNRQSDLINATVRILRGGKLYAIEADDEGNEVVRRYSVKWAGEGAGK